MENQHHLPDEIGIHILSRLPADSIIRFKLVCKAWRSIIEEDPVFHDMHLRRLIDDSSTAPSSLGFVVLESVRQSSSSSIRNHYVRFAEYKHTEEEVMNFKRWKLPITDPYFSIAHKNLNLAIVGSCNGLVCISTADNYKPTNHHTYVCNPWTGEVLDISDSISNYFDHNVIRLGSLILVGIGFGYLPSTNEYKVVRIYASSDDTLFSDKNRSIKHVQVYTLGSRSGGGGRWRTIVPQISSSSWSDDVSFSSARDENNHPVFGVSVNGSLYFDSNYKNIVSFDLTNEEFRIVVPPAAAAPADSTSTDIDGLGVLGGCLCATKSSRRLIFNPPINPANTTIADLWVMEKKDNNKDDDQEESSSSWIKKFSLPPETFTKFYTPLGALASPPRILLQSKFNKKLIVSFNPETDDSYHMNTSSNIPYVKSCVSLKALGERPEKEDHGSYDYAV